MLSQEDNELLTHVGRGTPTGDLLRRYWQPALLASELPGPDSDPLRVRLLGEDLVAFRDTSGRPGLLGAHCPHRGASLWFGSDAAHLVNFKRNGKNVPTARGLTANAYRHLVFTWDATAQKYTWYVDGTPVTSKTVTFPTNAGTAPFQIGRGDQFGNEFMDEVAVYNTALTPTRISAHHGAATA